MRCRTIHNYRCEGFTFVEMVLVLLIVGFLLVVISASSSLIMTSRLQSVIAEEGDYHALYDSFKMRYSALPGDTLEGYMYWSDSGCSDSDVTSVSTGCNGDGNGRVGDIDAYESLLAWRHIHLSGSLEFPYAGVVNNDDAVMNDTTRNVVGSDVKGGAWLITYVDIYGQATNALTLARLDEGEINRAILNPEQAEAIDLKVDDGLPDQGDVLVMDGVNLESGFDCVDGASGVQPAAIVITEDDVACRLIFTLQ